MILSCIFLWFWFVQQKNATQKRHRRTERIVLNNHGSIFFSCPKSSIQRTIICLPTPKHKSPMSPQKKPVLSKVSADRFCGSVRNTSVCHLVMRIKRLNDATVAAESPPPEHEQIFDLSQVIRSVGEELQKHKRKLVLTIFISFPLYSTQCFIVSC